MLLTTHDMDDIEALCSRVMVIGRGQLLFDGSMDTLRAQYAPHRIIKARLSRECETLSIPGAKHVHIDGRSATITFLPQETPAEQIIARLAAACPIADLTVEAPDIERLIADLYEELKL